MMELPNYIFSVRDREYKMEKLHLLMIAAVVIVAGIFLFLVLSHSGPAFH